MNSKTARLLRKFIQNTTNARADYQNLKKKYKGLSKPARFGFKEILRKQTV